MYNIHYKYKIIKYVSATVWILGLNLIKHLCYRPIFGPSSLHENILMALWGAAAPTSRNASLAQLSRFTCEWFRATRLNAL
jgi:hypothetical protein